MAKNAALVFGKSRRNLRKVTRLEILPKFGFLRQDMTDWQRFIKVYGLFDHCAACSQKDCAGVLVVTDTSARLIHECEEGEQIPRGAEYTLDTAILGRRMLVAARHYLCEAAHGRQPDRSEEKAVQELEPALA